MTTEEMTDDERAGMAWWNNMTEPERLQAMEAAGTAIPAKAWAHHKAQIRAGNSQPPANNFDS